MAEIAVSIVNNWVPAYLQFNVSDDGSTLMGTDVSSGVRRFVSWDTSADSRQAYASLAPTGTAGRWPWIDADGMWLVISGSPVMSLLRRNGSVQRWTAPFSLPPQPVVVVNSTHVYILGGNGTSPLPVVVTFDRSTEMWSSAAAGIGSVFTEPTRQPIHVGSKRYWPSASGVLSLDVSTGAATRHTTSSIVGTTGARTCLVLPSGRITWAFNATSTLHWFDPSDDSTGNTATSGVHGTGVCLWGGLIWSAPANDTIASYNPSTGEYRTDTAVGVLANAHLFVDDAGDLRFAQP